MGDDSTTSFTFLNIFFGRLNWLFWSWVMDRPSFRATQLSFRILASALGCDLIIIIIIIKKTANHSDFFLNSFLPRIINTYKLSLTGLKGRNRSFWKPDTLNFKHATRPPTYSICCCCNNGGIITPLQMSTVSQHSLHDVMLTAD